MKKLIGERKHRVVYTFRFAIGSEIIFEIRANTHFCAYFVEMRGDFEGGTRKVEGLLGNPQVAGMFGRDAHLSPHARR